MAVGAARLRVSRPPVGIALAVTVAAEGALVVLPRVNGAEGFWFVIMAAAGWAFVVTDPQLESRPWFAVGAIALACVLAISAPPRGSHDVWSYVMYGRTVAVHHANPYVHAPRDYPHDPFLHLVASGWKGTRSLYGPLFTGASAVLAKLAGASVLRARLAFQGLALMGVVAVLATLWVETRSARTLAFVGLHPAVVIAIVNGGHNDGLVGLAVLVGVVLVGRARFTAGGVAVGLGMLVKASTGFGVIGIAVWALGRDRRGTARFVSAALVTSAAGYLPFATTALSSITSVANRTSRASIWSPISRALPGLTGDAAVAVVIVLVVAAGYRFRSRAVPTLAATGAVAAYLFAGAYVLPWYPAWALPSAAFERRSWLAILVAVHAAFLVAIYELPRRALPGSFVAVVRGAVVVTMAFAVLATFVAVVSRATRADVAGRLDAPA